MERKNRTTYLPTAFLSDYGGELMAFILEDGGQRVWLGDWLDNVTIYSHSISGETIAVNYGTFDAETGLFEMWLEIEELDEEFANEDEAFEAWAEYRMAESSEYAQMRAEEEALSLWFGW